MPRKFKLRSDRSEVFLNGRFYTDKARVFSETKDVIKRFEAGFLYEVFPDSTDESKDDGRKIPNVPKEEREQLNEGVSTKPKTTKKK